MRMSLGSFKKIHEDNQSATLMHPSGHKIVVSKASLNNKLKADLASLPNHMEEGGVAPGQAPLDIVPAPNEEPLDISPATEQDSVPMPAMAEQPSASFPVDRSVATGAAPVTQGSVPPTAPGTLGEMKAGEAQQLAGINQRQQAEQQESQLRAGAAQQQYKDIQNLKNDFDKRMSDRNQQYDHMMQDYKDAHITPDHYWSSKSTPGKISTAIGLILGGIGGGLLGQENPALKFLNENINRDLEGQKMDLGKKNNILSAFMAQTKDMNEAMMMTKGFYQNLYATKIDEAAAKSGDLAAQARAKMASGSLRDASAKDQAPFLMKQTILDAVKNGNISDPSVLVPVKVPAEHQKKVFEEIERAQDTRRMSDAILKAFDQAAKDNTLVKSLGGLRTPPTVLALHQALQPTFKDLEGTVRQAAMDNTFRNISPSAGDLESTTATKRAALVDYLQSKASAPTAKAFGIDLSQFPSTAPNKSDGQPGSGEQSNQYYQWAVANPENPLAKQYLAQHGAK